MIGSTLADDEKLLQEMRRRNGATVNQLICCAGVSRTAIRQKLSRLMHQGLVQRRKVRQTRGRPFFEYATTDRSERLFGSNCTDLAVSLWRAVTTSEGPTTRRELVRRVCDILAEKYQARIHSDTLEQRLEKLCQVLAERGIDVEIDRRSRLPVLRQHDCPYSSLAAADRGICALEKQVLARLMGCRVELTRSRMSEDECCCCEFEMGEYTLSVLHSDLDQVD